MGKRKDNAPSRQLTRADYPAIFGDTDEDRIEDVDDPRPLIPGDIEGIEEVRLADEMAALLEARDEFMPVEKELRSTLADIDVSGATIKSRVKTPFSIINKLRRKRLSTLTDIAGAMMVVPDQKALDRAASQIEKRFDVIEREDYYRDPQNGYRAKHYIVRVQGKPVELQLKTHRMAEIAKASHTAYKRGDLDAEAMEEITELAWKADKGNDEAAAEVDRLIVKPAELRARLRRAANPRFDCELLPEDPWAYFTRPPGTVLMPLVELIPTGTRRRGIKNAEKLMKAACKGEQRKRAPITVEPDTMRITDGNSTYAVAKAWGWQQIPVQFERASNPDSRILALARRLAGGGR